MVRCGARLNAVTHGLTAETLILPGEDPRAFQRRLDAWTAELEPANPFEHDLVRQVVTLSWRLDRADRVQDALIADSLGTIPLRQRREEVADLGRRLLPPPRVPNFVRRFGVWADLDRLAHRGPDDPDDPPGSCSASSPPPTAADGCSTAGPSCGRSSTPAPPGRTRRWSSPSACWASGRSMPSTTSRCLTIFVACYVMDRSRPDPFAELWKTTTDREANYYRQRLLGRRLLEAKPRSKEQAREVLLEIVDAAVSRLEEEERQHRRRERELAALRADSQLFDASAEGEWVRREQGKATRSILRITERFRKARKRGETLNPDPPKPPRLEPVPPRPLETRPVVGPQQRMEDPYARPAGQGLTPPVLIFDHPSLRQPKEYIGGRGAGRRKEIKNLRKRKGRRCSQEKAERIAIRAIKWLADLGLAVLIVAALGTTAGAPVSARPEHSPRRAQPVILDDALDHPSPGLAGPESLILPLNRASNPRKKQNEAKDREVAQVMPARAGRPSVGAVARPARSGIRPFIGRSIVLRARRRRPVAIPRVSGGYGPAGRDIQPLEPTRRIPDNSNRSCNRRSSRAGPSAHPGPPPTRT